MSIKIDDILGAAAWAAERHGNDTMIRDAAAVAGRVQACSGVTQTEAVAAWIYRVCERPGSTLGAQQTLLAEIEATFSKGVVWIVQSLATPPDVTSEEMREMFLNAPPHAKRIRVCETIVGLSQAVTLLLHGSVGNLDPIRTLAEFASFVYTSSTDQVDAATLLDLHRLLAALKSLWDTLANVTRLFNDQIAPPLMIPVRILAVTNDTEIVAVACLSIESPRDKYHTVFQGLREQIGGAAFTESVLDATLPLPKWGTATIVSSGTGAPS